MLGGLHGAGGYWESPHLPRGPQWVSPLPAVGQQELLSKGHSGVASLGTMCPYALALQLVLLSPLHLPCCPTFQLGVTFMSPSLLSIFLPPAPQE